MGKDGSGEGSDSSHTVSIIQVGDLTKREYFAGLAMQGMLANPRYVYVDEGGELQMRIATSEYAVERADALIKDLNKETTND